MTYPYWIVTTRTGRLPVPVPYRGTGLARQFTSGRLGGSVTQEVSTSDKAQALALYRQAKRDNLVVEVYTVPLSHHLRRRLPDPERALAAVG